MVRYNGPIRVFNPSDGIPTDAAGGGAGGDQTAAALAGMSAQAQAAWQTVDNLSATATTGPVGSGASVTITGTVPNKTINFTIPRGRDGKDGIGNDAAVQVAMSQQAGTAMRVGVEAGTVGLLVIADSKGAGTGLTNYVDRWQNRLAALMRARFPIAGGDTMRGLIPANMSDPYNAMSGRPTTTGTTYPVDTAGLGYNTLQLELGSTLTFPAATWPAASTLPIGYHTHSGANGTLQVLIDGVVQTEINCAGAGEGAPMRTSIPIAAGTHTVSMRPKAGTAPVRVMYIEQRSTATGWHLYDAARPGLAARHVVAGPSGAPAGDESFAAAVAGLPSVRLAVVALGANDMTISAPAQYGRDVRAVVDMVKTAHPLTGVVVVLPAALTDDSAVVDDVSAYHTAARSALTGVPDLSILAETQLVDLTGPNAGAWLADSVHPNAFGHDLISRALAGSLIGLDGPSDALTLVEAAAAPAITAAQSAQTSAAQSATSAEVAATRAENAEGFALAPAAEVIADTMSNSTTEAVKRLGVLTPATVDHVGVQAALNSAATFGLRVQTAGSYSTDQTLVIKGHADLSGLRITYTGSTVAVKVGPDTGSLTGAVVNLPSVTNGNKVTTGWAAVAGTIGVRLRNTVGCSISWPEVAGFETGVQFLGDTSGNVHNKVAAGRLANNKVNLNLHAVGAGWTNENVFTGGHFFHYSGEAAGGSGSGMTGPAAGTRHVLLSSASTSWAGPNSNKFYGAAMENVGATEFAVDFDNAGRNLFDGCRWETWLGGVAGYPPRVRYGTVATENIIRGGYDSHRIEVTTAAGGSTRGNNIESGLGARYHFANQTISGPGSVGGWVLDNASGASAPVIQVMPANWETLGTDRATGWTWKWTGLVLEGKRTGDAFPRVRFDANLGQLRLGSGTTEPASGLVGTASDLRAMSTFAPLTHAAFDLGVGVNRWRNVYVSNEVHVGSLILRDSGGVLQCWSGGAWKTVNLT